MEVMTRMIDCFRTCMKEWPVGV